MDYKTYRKTDKDVVVLPGAIVVGDVAIGPDSSIWFNAVLRGDNSPITLGRGCNIQDNAVVHSGIGFPVQLGDFVTVGHGAIVHGCTVGSHTLIGMGSILLNGSVIGDHCLVGAGSLVTGKLNAPSGSLIMGNPATVRRPLTQAELEQVEQGALNYIKEKELYR